MAPITRNKTTVDKATPTSLLDLADDVLAKMGHALADPLDPRVAVALGSTAKGLRGPMRAALALLRTRYAAAEALAKKMGTSCAQLGEGSGLSEEPRGPYPRGILNASDVDTLGMLIRTNALQNLTWLKLSGSPGSVLKLDGFFAGLGPGSLPRLSDLSLWNKGLGPTGACALAAALTAGAMPRLTCLAVCNDWPIGDAGVAKLAVPLRKRPGLRQLSFRCSGVTDAGLASLLSNLGEKEFKQLQTLELYHNPIGDAGCAMLVSLIDSDELPLLHEGLHNVMYVNGSFHPVLISNATPHPVRMALERAAQRCRDAAVLDALATLMLAALPDTMAEVSAAARVQLKQVQPGGNSSAAAKARKARKEKVMDAFKLIKCKMIK